MSDQDSNKLEIKELYGLDGGDDNDRTNLLMQDLNYGVTNISSDSQIQKLDKTANESSSNTLLVNNAEEERSDFLTIAKPKQEKQSSITFEQKNVAVLPASTSKQQQHSNSDLGYDECSISFENYDNKHEDSLFQPSAMSHTQMISVKTKENAAASQ